MLVLSENKVAEIVFCCKPTNRSNNQLGVVAIYFTTRKLNVFALDGFYRSSFSSNPSPSAYLVVDGYTLINGRVGFRAAQGISLFVWGRNLFDTDYFEQLLPAGGNAGHYAGVLGDPRTYGVTLRYAF